MTYRAVIRTLRIGTASDPGGGVQAALRVLFPQAESSQAVARSAAWRGASAALQVAAVCAGAVVLLYRIGGTVPAWDCLYAEDGGVFLPDALAHPWHLLVSFGGYEELMPRLICQLVSYLPLADAAFACAVAGAVVASLCALFIYHATEGYIRTPWLRALLGAALILLPLAPIEIADSVVSSPWYALAATFFALLWRPRTWAGMAAAALIAFYAASSEVFAIVYLPLVLIRIVALPRWREQAVSAGWAAGLLVQLPVVLSTYLTHTQRLGGLKSPGVTVPFYFHSVLLRALGWHLSIRFIQVAGYNGATAIVCAILAVMVGWAVAQGGQARVFAVTALVTGFVATVFAATVVSYVIYQPPHYGNPLNFEGGSRYSTIPIILLDAIAVVAADSWLRRRPSHRSGRLALAAAVAVACVLASGWAVDYRYLTERTTNGYWAPTAQSWLDACAHSRNGKIRVPAWQVGYVVVDCSRLRR
jgi:hypothetical protein